MGKLQHTCHEAVTEVVLTMLIILDIVPLEVGSAATNEGFRY